MLDFNCCKDLKSATRARNPLPGLRIQCKGSKSIARAGNPLQGLQIRCEGSKSTARAPHLRQRSPNPNCRVCIFGEAGPGPELLATGCGAGIGFNSGRMKLNGPQPTWAGFWSRAHVSSALVMPAAASASMSFGYRPAVWSANCHLQWRSTWLPMLLQGLKIHGKDANVRSKGSKSIARAPNPLRGLHVHGRGSKSIARAPKLLPGLQIPSANSKSPGRAPNPLQGLQNHCRTPNPLQGLQIHC